MEKQNSSKVEEIQIKSLDYTEHDSLDTITTSTTNTSSESKRSENVLKALERRYHLLYLNAFETQCMFEGLLDKRNFFNSTRNIDDFDSTDDEFEPIAKIPKIDENTNFTSSKPNNNDEEVDTNNIPSDIDADSEDSPDEMECIALKGLDCVDSKTVPIISPKVSNTYIEETDKSFNTPKVAVVRRSKDISKFNRSNRKSKNCAIFYYKHVDTDNDQVTNNENEQNLASETTSEEEIWEYANANQSHPSQMMESQEETIIESIHKESESHYDDDDDADLKTNSLQQQNNVSNTPQVSVEKYDIFHYYYFFLISNHKSFGNEI